MADTNDGLPALTPEQREFADKMAAELKTRFERYGRDLLASDVKREVFAYLEEVMAPPKVEFTQNPDGSLTWHIPADMLPTGFDPERV